MKDSCYMLYARVSPKGSDWSAEETSISMQIDEMKKFVLRRDPDAKFLIRSDEFKSGKDLNRPGIRSILDELKEGTAEFGTLVVWALDRLSRSLKDAVPLFELLRDAGCGFLCVRQDYLSTQGAMARFTLNQTILIAQLEREMTSERVKAKMVHIAEDGKYPAGRAPLGFRRVPGSKNLLQPDPETAPVVREIFSDYIGGKISVVEIRRKFSKYIHGANQLYRILRNRLYIGEVEYDGKSYPGKHPAIVGRDLFDAVQSSIVSDRRQARKKTQKYDYLLQGLVRCKCGKKMVPYSIKKGNGKRYFYYKCQDVIDCKKAINAEKLDQRVIEAIKPIVFDADYIRERIAAWEKMHIERETCNNRQIVECRNEKAAAEKSLSEIETMFLKGIVTKENAAYWNEKLLEIRNRIEDCDARIADLQADHCDWPEITIEDILAQLKQWSEILSRTDNFQIKRNLVLNVIDSVYFDENDEIELSLVMTKGYDWRRERDSNSR